ncbi:MAG TPA: hypothetical protein VI072_17715 [Polyangiaceae bacterium]
MATPLVAQFLFDHAYRASPEPYAGKQLLDRIVAMLVKLCRALRNQ